MPDCNFRKLQSGILQTKDENIMYLSNLCRYVDLIYLGFFDLVIINYGEYYEK